MRYVEIMDDELLALVPCVAFRLSQAMKPLSSAVPNGVLNCVHGAMYALLNTYDRFDSKTS